MGLSPDQVLAMPLHDYQAALHHYARSQGGDDDTESLADDEFDDMMVAMAARDAAAVH